MARAFVIRPFGQKHDATGRVIDFDRVDRELIGPALAAADLEGGTTGQLVDAGSIREDMFSLILEAHLVVCDVTVHNANVFYELGIRHALRKRHTVMIRGDITADATPFDLATDRYITYPIDDPAAAMAALTRAIRATLVTDRPTDSPVFHLLPMLQEADPQQAKGMPADFVEEVQRAEASHAVGWLRLLSDEVRSRRFALAGLALVARAQWELGDHDGALDSWSQVRALDPDDIEASLALANVYERLYRRSKDRQHLVASNQAIERVLANPAVQRSQLAEARALRGRNLKTLWRLGFADAGNVDKARALALSPDLLDAYDAYREAYFDDLNYHYPGINAVSAGLFLLELSNSPDWAAMFADDDQAQATLEQLRHTLPSLRHIASVTVNATLHRLGPDHPKRMWAELGAADLAFLSEAPNARRVLRLYRDAIPVDSPAVWAAARTQLEIFSQLGVRKELAEAVIAEIDGRQPAGGAQRARPLHLVVFAGHTVDTPSRPEPRFPPTAVPQAELRLREALAGLRDDVHDLVLLASAAPGADILAHEACSHLGIASVVCLPMPPASYSSVAFERHASWRSRFLDLMDGRKLDQGVLTLSHQEGLSNWLRESAVDPWERGNRWVHQLALTWGANRLTLVALWDGKVTGDTAGGTAHVVKLARDSGVMREVIIDANVLRG